MLKGIIGGSINEQLRKRGDIASITFSMSGTATVADPIELFGDTVELNFTLSATASLATAIHADTDDVNLTFGGSGTATILDIIQASGTAGITFGGSGTAELQRIVEFVAAGSYSGSLVEEGDIIVHVEASTSSAPASPAGFTDLSSSIPCGSRGAARWSYKEATASESNYTISPTATHTRLVLRNALTPTVFTTETASSQTSTNTGVASGVDYFLIHSLACTSNNTSGQEYTWSTPVGFTTGTKDADEGSDVGTEISYDLTTRTAASGNIVSVRSNTAFSDHHASIVIKV